ncbi:MAG: polymer-forming cytoskeletal protein, partial [Paracoccaceae bacterium]|nr:polymer-forming cytoskeletal protein [Paracoccaceae bacterium]
MFSKSRINEPVVKPLVQPEAQEAVEQKATHASPKVDSVISGISSPKHKASVLSANLTVVGNLNTTGDVEVEGTIEGDIRAHLLTIGEGATIRGEVIADDIVINGHIIGRVRGLKVRLTSTAKVEG